MNIVWGKSLKLSGRVLHLFMDHPRGTPYYFVKVWPDKSSHFESDVWDLGSMSLLRIKVPRRKIVINKNLR